METLDTGADLQENNRKINIIDSAKNTRIFYVTVVLLARMYSAGTITALPFSQQLAHPLLGVARASYAQGRWHQIETAAVVVARGRLTCLVVFSRGSHWNGQW